MRFGLIGPPRPESFPKTFNVYETQTDTNSRGRVKMTGQTPKAQLSCILSVAKPEEREAYHQRNVTVTHRILQRGSPQAEEGNIFALFKNGKETRFFRVKAVHNKGEMDIHTMYYCEERNDRT